MKHRKKNKSKYPYPFGYMASGGILAMLFCKASSNPTLMFSLGAALVVFSLVCVLCRKGDKNHIGFDPEA